MFAELRVASELTCTKDAPKSVTSGFLTSFIIAPNIMKPRTKARTSSLSTDER